MILLHWAKTFYGDDVFCFIHSSPAKATPLKSDPVLHFVMFSLILDINFETDYLLLSLPEYNRSFLLESAVYQYWTNNTELRHRKPQSVPAIMEFAFDI